MESEFRLVALFIGFILLIFVALGVGSIVATARRRHRHSALLAGGVRDTATVVDNRVTSHTDTDGNSGLTFQAVVVLDHQDGAEPVVLPDGVSSSYVVGTKLDVVYDPSNPRHVESITSPSVAGYVLGSMLLAVGLVGAGALPGLLQA